MKKVTHTNLLLRVFLNFLLLFQVIVLLIGTNNHGNSPEEISEGIKAICNLIRDKQPQAFLVVLTLLPRGQFPNPLRIRNAQVNNLVAENLKGNSRAQLVNIGMK